MIYSEPSVELDHYFNFPLPLITKHELGLPFLPRNLPIKVGTNPSTIFLVIVITDSLHRVSEKTSTHIIGYKLRNNCLILIIFDTKIPHII